MKKRKIGLPIQLLLVLVVGIVMGPYLSVPIKSFFLAVSISLKEILMTALPFIVFSYLFLSINQLQQGVWLFIITLVIGIVLSGIAATHASYIGSYAMSAALQGLIIEAPTMGKLDPMWTFILPKIRNEYALLSGAVIGIGCMYKPMPQLLHAVQRMRHYADIFLMKLFIPTLPIFIFGFVLQLQHQGAISLLVDAYLPMLGLLVLMMIVYIGGLFLLAAGGSWKRFVTYINNALPAFITSFITMSSAATLPLSLEAAERNTGKPTMVRAVLPATVNIHMVGVALCIPMMAIGMTLSTGGTMPSYNEYLLFVFYYLIAQFGVAAVPGGAIVVMLPLLETYLNLPSTMSALLTTVYFLFNSFVTTTNVAGNLAFCMLFTKVYQRLTVKETTHSA